MKTAEIKRFDSIKLEEMEKVKLMNRTDTKYWFHVSQLPELLRGIQQYYFVMDIDGELELPYSTTYFDTASDGMYAAHHNGKLNRFKVRRRTYVLSAISFLEVKFKNNKGRTIKRRIATNHSANYFNAEESAFLASILPFHVTELSTALVNRFSRLTLVNKNFNERCTIDFNLRFDGNNKQVVLDDLVIVEIKAEDSPAKSPLVRALRNQRIKKSGFSKYCVGRTVTANLLKRNAFKHKIRSIEKTIQAENNLYDFN